MFKAAQPALLYLVPFTLLPLFMMAYLKGDLKSMWHEPFAPHPTMSAELKIWKLGNWWIGETGWKCGEHYITTASFLMKKLCYYSFWQNIKTFRKLTTKKYFEEKRNQTQKKSRCKDFSEDFKKTKKNETHLIPSSSHSLTSFLKIRIYEFECYYFTAAINELLCMKNADAQIVIDFS